MGFEFTICKSVHMPMGFDFIFFILVTILIGLVVYYQSALYFFLLWKFIIFFNMSTRFNFFITFHNILTVLIPMYTFISSNWNSVLFFSCCRYTARLSKLIVYLSHWFLLRRKTRSYTNHFKYLCLKLW